MTLMIAALLLLLVAGVPIAMAFALVVLVRADDFGIWLDSIGSVPYDTISAFPLVAIPLFLLVGQVMNSGGLAKRLTLALDIALGKIPAALGHIAIAASAMLGAITGSSVATVAAIGGVLGPEMRVRGYAPGYIASLNAAAGLLGVLIPPSIPLILYGSIVGVSITELFVATLAPGLLMALSFFLVHAAIARRILPGGREQSVDSGERRPRRRTLREAMPAALLPLLVLGGIYSGVFTPTEAAAVAAIYAFLAAFAQRTLGSREIGRVLFQAALPAAAILCVIAFTSIFNRAMVLAQLPQAIATFATAWTADPLLFLLSVNLVLILIGMFMETNAAVLLMGPLLAPAAAAFDIDLIHFSIILVTNIEIGLLTPPLAANLYVAARTNGVSLLEMLPYFGFFLLASVLVLLCITYVPEISLWYRLF